MTILGPTFCNEPVKIRDLAAIRHRNVGLLDKFPIKTHSRTDHVTGKVEVWDSRACTRLEPNETGRLILVYYADADLNYMELVNSPEHIAMVAEYRQLEAERASVDALCASIELV